MSCATSSLTSASFKCCSPPSSVLLCVVANFRRPIVHPQSVHERRGRIYVTDSHDIIVTITEPCHLRVGATIAGALVEHRPLRGRLEQLAQLLRPFLLGVGLCR